jgi:predicted metalloendopeptidase
VIGHELMHAIAGSGRALDAEAQWRDWWSLATVAGYEQTGGCLRRTYDRFEILPASKDMQAIRVDGARTLEENVADLGGIAAAHEALTTWLADGAPHAPSLPGLTDEQLFFLSYAQLWCEQMTPGALVSMVYFDVHAPGRFRVNGTLSQFPPFARAFGCTATDPMVGKPQCSLFADAPPDSAAAVP